MIDGRNIHLDVGRTRCAYPLGPGTKFVVAHKWADWLINPYRLGGKKPWSCVLVCSWRRPLADRHSLPFPSLSFSEGPPSRCFGPPFPDVGGGDGKTCGKKGVATGSHRTGLQTRCCWRRRGLQCLLHMLAGAYLRQRRDKIRSGYITPAFSGSHNWAEVLRNPYVLGGLQERGQNQKWLFNPCVLRDPQKRGWNQKWLHHPVGGKCDITPSCLRA